LIPNAARVEMPVQQHSYAHPLSFVSDSDSIYHRLFSDPRMVEALVREFLPEALAAGLDFSGLQRVNPKFHIGRGAARRREGDVIWRLPTREGADIYLYLLLEFQSRSEWWMAVRTQVYEGLLWQQVIDERRLKVGARLPPMLLLVIYNGARRWNAATQTSELIALPPQSALWPWQPQVRYYLLDIGAFTKSQLARRASLAALLFRLEQRHSPEELNELLAEVLGWFREHEGYEKLRELFTELVRAAFAGHGVKVPKSGDLLEMKTMIETQFDAWKEQWVAEGEAKGAARGKAEGKAEGKTEGKAEALLCLLAERFGDVAPSWHRRIRSAELSTLEHWFKRAIAAPDVPSVFEPPPC
jgi:predicted transposase YdaD